MNLVFLGDSVTDCSRKRAAKYQQHEAALGNGWVRFVNKTLQAAQTDLQLWNRGFSGCLTAEVMTHQDWWPQVEDQAIRAELTTLMIGINDVWHPFWRARPHDMPAVTAAFEQLLLELKRRSTQVLVIEPIALPIGEVTQSWWPILDQLSDMQQQVCQQQSVHWLPLQNALVQSAQAHPVDYLADGVHPTDLGHRWLAKQWRGYVQTHNLLHNPNNRL